MRRYLLSIYQPDGAPPPEVDLKEIGRAITAVIDDMKSSGAWVFNGGLFPPSTATVVRVKDGDLLMTDGPYTEGKEHIGGLVIVQSEDLDGALEWARRSAEAIGLPIEVRPIVDEDRR